MSTGLPNRSESSAAMLNKAQSRRLPRFEFDQEVDIALGSEVVSERRAEDGKTCNAVGTAEFSQAVSWRQYVLVHDVGSCRCVSMFRKPDFISSEVGERGFVQGVLPQSACACQALFEFGVRSDFCAESQFAQKVIVNQDFLCKAARPVV